MSFLNIYSKLKTKWQFCCKHLRGGVAPAATPRRCTYACLSNPTLCF